MKGLVVETPKTCYLVSFGSMSKECEITKQYTPLVDIDEFLSLFTNLFIYKFLLIKLSSCS